MPWYPSAKACPAAIKPTVQCFFPTLYQVLLFDFSSFGEKLFFCLRGYRRAIAQSAVQKTAGAQSAAPAGAFRSATAAGGTWRGDRMFLCSPAAEQAANGWRRQPDLTAGEAANPAPPPTSYRHAAQSWHLT